MDYESDEQTHVRREFEELVNMAPAELEHWLSTDESRQVGSSGADGGESIGHGSGRRIIAIRRARKADLTDDDYAHMSKVVGYIKRHAAQGPPEKTDAHGSRWRYSLMNWGHDPEKR